MKLPSPNPPGFRVHSYQGIQLRLRKARWLVASGFTLVELLLGLLIVAVLIAILVPAVERAMYQARKTKSIGNLRAIGAALSAYVTDNNGKLPEGGFRPTLNRQTVRYWYNALDFYFGGQDWINSNWKNLNRPAWQVDPLKKYPDPPSTDGGFAVNVGYGWNHSFFGYTPDWYPESLGWGGRLSQVEIPSETIIIGTNSDTDSGLGNALIYPSSNAAKRYNGGGLYLLLDGHVSAYTPAQILENDNHLFRKKKKP